MNVSCGEIFGAIHSIFVFHTSFQIVYDGVTLNYYKKSCPNKQL
ncbi:hypothetical protein SAMN04487935_0915 [Flavobacterium noncentrifugens]|uniref:Uncharacterized protein n=1 Tax=Flavobacterium noncentrifugens TaxID=1128970 RepID=A0A1G8TCF3_9FLAO|nr:hypothetical protein SAMN04487935_0915 [Flavobacterium noncentrifugens]